MCKSEVELWGDPHPWHAENQEMPACREKEGHADVQAAGKVHEQAFQVFVSERPQDPVGRTPSYSLKIFLILA